MYLAVRSPRAGAPALIWPAAVPTARSAIESSPVSPDLWLITVPQPLSFAIATASSVSDTVPIWLSLISTALAASISIPRRSRSVLVTKRSSPTICTLRPSRSVRHCQWDQSSSAMPSSMLMIGYFPRPLLVLVEKLPGVEYRAFPEQRIASIVQHQLRGRDVHGEEAVLAGHVSRLLDGGEGKLHGLLVGGQGRREPAFVAEPRRCPSPAQDVSKGVVGLDAGAEGVAEAVESRGHHHELLEVRRVVGVATAVDYVEHGRREGDRPISGEVLVQGRPTAGCGGPGDREGDPQHGVCAKPSLVRRAVDLDERPVDGGLVVGADAGDCRGDAALDIVDRTRNPKPPETPGVAVAQLDRLKRT